MAWIEELCKRISSSELAKDITEAEEMLEQHQQTKVCALPLYPSLVLFSIHLLCPPLMSIPWRGQMKTFAAAVATTWVLALLVLMLANCLSRCETTRLALTGGERYLLYGSACPIWSLASVKHVWKPVCLCMRRQVWHEQARGSICSILHGSLYGTWSNAYVQHVWSFVIFAVVIASFVSSRLRLTQKLNVLKLWRTLARYWTSVMLQTGLSNKCVDSCVCNCLLCWRTLHVVTFTSTGYYHAE